MGQISSATRTLPALLLLFGAGAFWDGLYTPAAQLLAAAVAALMALVGPRAVSLSRLELVAVGLLLFGVGASLLHPAATGVAVHGPVIAGGWLLAMLAGRALAHGGLTEVHLARFWAITGALMAFGGLVLISFTPLHHSGRLASFLGYPIAVGVLGLLGLTGALPDLAAGRWWAAPLLLGNGLALVLSGSRWVWLTALLLLIYLLMTGPDLLRRAFRPGISALVLALTASLWAAPAVAQRAAPRIWLILAISLLTLGALLRFHESRYLWRGSWGVAAVLMVLAPGWAWLLGRASALPLTEGSSVERLTFLRDGLALLQALPLGGGFRAWSALHLQAASYAYYSAEVHSAPLDMALAFGWVGGAGFLLLLGRFLVGLRRAGGWSPFRLAALAGLGALALHALLDWDLSYALFSFPLWFGFGLIPPKGRPVHLAQPVTITLAAVTLVAATVVGAGDLFAQQARGALERRAPEAALLHAGAAVAITPWNDLAHGLLGEAQARLGLGEAALSSLRTARRLGPYEPWYAQLLAQELSRQGRAEEAAQAYREYVGLWPWQITVYEEALQAHVDLIVRAQAAGDTPRVVELARSGRAILERLSEQKAREPAKTPRRPMQVETPAVQQARRVIESIGP